MAGDSPPCCHHPPLGDTLGPATNMVDADPRVLTEACPVRYFR